MGFNKQRGIAVVAGLIILAVFNIIAFLFPIEHTITFWIGYGFTTLAVVLFLCTAIFLFGRDGRDKMFRGLPLISIGWIYFVLQVVLGLVQMVTPAFAYMTALVSDCIITGVFIIIILASKAAIDAIEKEEKYVAQKIGFITDLQSKVSLMQSEDREICRMLNRLKEDIQFSDPMSHSELYQIEKNLQEKIEELKVDIKDSAKAADDINKATEILRERNEKCKLLKNTQDDHRHKDNSGAKYATVAVGIMGLIVTIALVVGFVIIPGNTYDKAMALYNDGKYEEAREIFEELDGYSDSGKMIAACNEAIDEEQYALAETKTEEKDYLGAIKIYTELGDYKDSKQKVEGIYNRLAGEDVIYYGTYKGTPIGWEMILTRDNSKMLLIAAEAVDELQYNEEVKNVKWNDCSLKEWLNSDFLESFSEEQLQDIIATDVDGVDNKVFLLSENEVEELEDTFSVSAEKDWWLRTKDGTNAVYVSANGEIIEDGDQVVRAKGIRPCIWIDLK